MYRVFLENLLFSRGYKLDINHMKGKNVYTCHIYMLWHLRIWLVTTKSLSILLLQERFKLAFIFLNTAFGTKKDIAYSRLVNSAITNLCIRPIFTCMVLFWIFNNEPVSKVSKRIHVWNLIRYKVHPNFLSRRQFLCAPFSSTI